MKFGDQLKDLTWISPESILYQGVRTKLTPMIEQYLDAKAQYPTDILLFRMGDFYESFFDDAKNLSRVLDLTLTSRNKGENGEMIPMAGIPHKTLDEYIVPLIDAGMRVSICDQLEDPTKAIGLVKRGITQIVTPGTYYDSKTESKNSRMLASIAWNLDNEEKCCAALAEIDLATGYCSVTEINENTSLVSELKRTNVKEIVTHTKQIPQFELLTNVTQIAPQILEPQAFTTDGFFKNYKQLRINETAHVQNQEKLESFFEIIAKYNFNNPKLVQNALAGLFSYILDLHYPISTNINDIHPYIIEKFVQIDEATFQNLEIFETMRGGQKKGALLHEIDETLTTPGARLLKNWITHPLKNITQINERLDSTEELVKNFDVRDKLRVLLTNFRDLEKLATKLATQKANPKDLYLLKQTLQIIPNIKNILININTKSLQNIRDTLQPLDDLTNILEKALLDTPPTLIGDAPIFKDGYNQKLDKYRSLALDGKQWLLNFEAQQKKLTDISSLKVKYQRIFGYFIEVTKANLSLVPKNYIRKQTLANCERFYTPELKEYEEELLSAEENKNSLEVQLFTELCEFASSFIPTISENAKQIALLDVFTSFAHTAHQRQYTKPHLNDNSTIKLTAARHPVVENCLPKGERFVPNDIELDKNNNRLIIITGPNMAGKSTIIRQTAILVLMAQIGSFVPAENAEIGIVDRIFSRVGASDNLALGQSTFMVEMTETANIVQNATHNSLVILDEIGRGTSTYDGLSLAWAIAEYLHSNVQCRTLFATHYHELTELEYSLKGVKNCSVAVKEYNKDIIFLRKLINAPANRSYGIQVARLAGVPEDIILRAETLLKNLEKNAHNELSTDENRIKLANATPKSYEKSNSQQLTLFAIEPATHTNTQAEELLHEIKNLTLDALTPIQALNLLYKWCKKYK